MFRLIVYCCLAKPKTFCLAFECVDGRIWGRESECVMPRTLSVQGSCWRHLVLRGSLWFGHVWGGSAYDAVARFCPLTHWHAPTLLEKGKVFTELCPALLSDHLSHGLSAVHQRLAGIDSTFHTVWQPDMIGKQGVPRQVLKELSLWPTFIFFREQNSSVSHWQDRIFGSLQKSVVTLSDELEKLVGEGVVDTDTGTLVSES